MQATSSGTTGEAASTSSSTGEVSGDETTGGVQASCGDGVLDAGEFCDDGVANGLDEGDCAPDCSAVIEQRAIFVTIADVSGSFAADTDGVVSVLDALCATEFGAGARALFAYGEERRATTTPLLGDDAVDWVLDPWTRYDNGFGELVDITGAVPLLGVGPDGTAQPLQHALWMGNSNPVVTGMNTDWTTIADDDCMGWTASTGSMAQGNPGFVGDGDFLRLPGNTTCNNDRAFYCVLP